jgi:hypothetical protein
VLTDISTFPAQAVADLALIDRMRLSRTSINAHSYLSTDFLNQFNEIAMSLDMLADWPDMFEDLQGWQPRSYIEHFERSGFSDAETVIAAYHNAPRVIRNSFDREVDSLSQLSVAGLRALENALTLGANFSVYEAATALGDDIRAHVSRLAAIIHAGQAPQPKVDAELSESNSISGMNQSDIDALFD